MEWIFWLALFGVAVSFQIVAVARRSRWGMLTNSVRWLRARLLGRLLLFPLWSWLTWHWFIEPRALAPGWGDDVVAVGVGVLIAGLIDYEDWHAIKLVAAAQEEVEQGGSYH